MPACGANCATSTTGCTSRLHERNGDWQPNANQRLQLIDEKDVDAAAGKSVQVECPVQWGSCRVEGYEPSMKLTALARSGAFSAL